MVFPWAANSGPSAFATSPVPIIAILSASTGGQKKSNNATNSLRLAMRLLLFRILDPVQNGLFRHRQRHAAILENAIMEITNIEPLAKLYFRERP
jgi:hypothetical protein